MIEQYKTQAAEIAKEFGIDTRPSATRFSAMMFVEFGYIETPEIVDQTTYLTALHELGHCAPHNNHTQGRPGAEDKRHYFDNGVLRSEAEAWNFALDKCIGSIEDASRRFMWDVCLGSYYRNSVELAGRPTRLWNGNRHHIEFVYDKPDKYFSGTVKRIQGGLKNFEIEFTDAID